MRKVMKFKFYNLISNQYLMLCTIIVFFMLNFSILINSGVLFAGGSELNSELKYSLLINNYHITASFYGLLLAIFLGAGTIGPDVLSGNIYILLSAYPSRKKYYIGTYLTAFGYMFFIQLLMIVNLFMMFYIFDVSFLLSDISFVFLEVLLNSLVIFSVTSVSSIWMKGYKAGIVGLAGYSFFSMYMFNQVPFINEELIVDIVRYKNILCNFLPMSNVLTPSVTDADVIQFYQCYPIIPDFHLYQFLYIVVFVYTGCLLFSKHELT